jgi:hypothetical protein
MFTAVLELIFITFKIMLLSAVYASFVLLITYLISVKSKNNSLKTIMIKKMKFWLRIHFIISLALFTYKFTYWQNTGLGENNIIPIGYNQTIQNEDLESTYFYPDSEETNPNQDGIEIENYIVKNEYLCAEVFHKNSITEKFDYLVYNLEEKKLTKFKNESDYQTFANSKKLPRKIEFYSFEKHYYEFIDNKPKWSWWLLP